MPTPVADNQARRPQKPPREQRDKVSMNLKQSLQRAVTLWPEQLAVQDEGRHYTYAEFGKRVAALAKALTDIGIGKGDVVACLAPNCHEYMELYFACAVTGIVLNPLNYRLSGGEIGNILSDSSARVLIAHEDFADLAASALNGEMKLETVVRLRQEKGECSLVSNFEYEEFLAKGHGAKLPDIDIQSTDLAQLYYTSGTTGRAKGVMLSHENCAFNALGAVAELSLSDKDCWLHTAPMFHLVDAWAIWAVTWVGGRHVFLPYFEAEAVIRCLMRDGVTLTALVPTMLAALLAAKNIHKDRLDHLRMILTAGSPVAPDTVRQTFNTMGCDYAQFYGMTETSPFLTISLPKSSMSELPDDELIEFKAKTGRPMIGVDVRVVREDCTDVKRNGVEVGEIVARGPNVTSGYWNAPDLTADAIRDGWIHTGDLAVVDDQGFLNIVDRKKDMIITGGENVFSTEVEYVLYDHPAVFECAVFGIPDEKWGETVKAVVVLNNGSVCTEEALIAFAKERLAKYKIPRSIDFAESLPKTGSGKIFKRGLREEYWKAHEKKVH